MSKRVDPIGSDDVIELKETSSRINKATTYENNINQDETQARQKNKRKSTDQKMSISLSTTCESLNKNVLEAALKKQPNFKKKKV